MAYINIFFPCRRDILYELLAAMILIYPLLPTGPCPLTISIGKTLLTSNAENADFDVDIFSTDINRHNQLSQEKAPVDSDYKFLQSATIGTEERDRNPRKKARISQDEYPTDVPTIHNEESKIIFPSKNMQSLLNQVKRRKRMVGSCGFVEGEEKLRTKYVEIPEDYDQEVDAENDVFKAKAPFCLQDALQMQH